VKNRVRVSARLVLPAALCVSAAGLACGSSSPHEQAASVAKSDESSASSVQLLAQDWSKGRVPDKYARQTLDALSADVEQQGKTLSSIQRRDSLIGQTIAAHDSISAQVKLLRHSFESSDKSAAQHIADALGAQSQKLDSLSKQLQPSEK
jgi:hypothetical protein